MDLTPLLAPRSIAVVGASPHGGRATGAVRNLLELGFSGPIYAINPKYSSVLDIPCYPTLSSLPDPVDLVAVGIPGEGVLPVLREAHQNGTRAAVIFASGYGEAGELGRQRQAELEAFAARTGMLICGPNCLGVINFHARSAGYSSTSPKAVRIGNVAVVSQSGSVIVALVRSLRGIGFSYLVSCGNECGVTSSEYLRYLVDDPNTRVVGAFLEGIKHPARFVEAADAARRAGKPLIVIKAGRSQLGSAASSAHTGSLAGSDEVQRALFRQKGVVHCDDLDEWIEAIEIYRHGLVPRAKGVGVIGLSGGENALLLDHAADVGLSVPPLSEDGKRRLAALLPWFTKAENPIDATGALTGDFEIYRKCLDVLAAEDDIGIIAVSQDCPAHFDLPVARAVAAFAREGAKPVVFVSNISGPYRPEVKEILEGAGVPYLQGLKEGLKAIKALIDYHTATRPVVQAEVRHDMNRAAAAKRILAQSGKVVTEDVAKSVLQLYGFPVVRERVVRTAAEAVRAAKELGYPVVAKIVSPDILHKAAIGGVQLNLTTPRELRSAISAIASAVARHQPNARIIGTVVQPMIRSGIEVILGVKRDPQFGAVIAFGLGGIFVESIRQFALRIAPLSAADAVAMLDEVPTLGLWARKTAPSLDPAPLLTPLLLRLSALATELVEEIAEIDLNPVILDPQTLSATVVDALIVRP